MFASASLAHLAITCGVAILAGIANVVAGGGTNIVFPTLLWLGLPPVVANATGAVGLLPGSISGGWGYRREIRATDRRWLWLVVPSIIGGGIGAVLLTHTPSTIFRGIAPFLVLASSALIALQPLIHRWFGNKTEQHAARRSTSCIIVAFFLQLVMATYGGYFGAGLGILLLTALLFLGLDDLQQANGLKNFFVSATRSVAVVYFIVTAALVWDYAIAIAIGSIAIGSIAGGYLGAMLARHLRVSVLRWIIVIVGVGMAIAILLTSRL